MLLVLFHVLALLFVLLFVIVVVVGETFERRGGAHMGFSERIDTVLNSIELFLFFSSYWYERRFEEHLLAHKERAINATPFSTFVFDLIIFI